MDDGKYIADSLCVSSVVSCVETVKYDVELWTLLQYEIASHKQAHSMCASLVVWSLSSFL